jgi:hypothetical protein
MALRTENHANPTTTGWPRLRLEPVPFGQTMLDGCWLAQSTDPGAELPGLVPVLDGVGSPVVRLLLSAAGWVPRPHHIVVAGRDVTLGYFSDQPPSMLTAIRADGGTVALLVAPMGSPSGAPATPNLLGDQRAWDSDGGAPAAPRPRTVR